LLCSFDFDLAFFSLALHGAWRSFAKKRKKGGLRNSMTFEVNSGLLAAEPTGRWMAEVDRWLIDKLDSSNWMTWKFQIKHLLLALLLQRKRKANSKQ